MFERLMIRAAALAHRRARERRSALAEAIREDSPSGIRVSECEDGVALEGRGLGRRFALEPELRWLFAARRR